MLVFFVVAHLDWDRSLLLIRNPSTINFRNIILNDQGKSTGKFKNSWPCRNMTVHRRGRACYPFLTKWLLLGTSAESSCSFATMPLYDPFLGYAPSIDSMDQTNPLTTHNQTSLKECHSSHHFELYSSI